MGAPEKLPELTPADIERLAFGPGQMTPNRCRARNITRYMQIIVMCDRAIAEAAEAREPCDPFREIRGWAESGAWGIVERVQS